MKKKICVLLIIFAFVTVGAFLLSACNNYSYEPVEDFFQYIPNLCGKRLYLEGVFVYDERDGL